MKALFASIAALTLVATPAIAAEKTAKPAATTKTVVTKGPKSTAVTTVTTKVKPNTTVRRARRVRHRATPRCTCAAKGRVHHKVVRKTTTKKTTA